MITSVEKSAGLKERFLSEFARHEVRLLGGASGPLAALRREAIAAFDRLGFPTRKVEAWKYTNVEPALRGDYQIRPDAPLPALSAAELDPYRIPGLDAHLAVVVNGRFAEALSETGALPEGVVVDGLARSLRERPERLEAHLARYADHREEPFVALNTAFAEDGVFIHVPRNTVVERPIHLIHLVDTDAERFLQPRHLFVAERGAEVTIIESYVARRAARTFTNAVTEAYVGENAGVSHYRIQHEGDHASAVAALHAYQAGHSRFTTFTATLSGGLVRNNVGVLPDAPGCESHLLGLFLARDRQHVDNHTFVDHARPECFSNELYKGVLDDRATGVFNGKIMVRRDAQKTNAYQSSKSIVLTDEANMFTKPELEIYADDVKCSHGATTGRIDENALFYLRARGISEADAKRLLLYAFAHDVVEHVRIEPLRAYLDAFIEARLA